MDRVSIKKSLNDVFQDVFDDRNLQISEEMTANDVEGWDSLNHITLIVAVEKQFGTSLSVKEVNSLKNVGDLIRLLETKKAA